MTTLSRTYLTFQYDGSLTTHTTTIQAVRPASTLEDADRAIFKGITISDEAHVVVTQSTIFHPQGGGQPSDVGTMGVTPTTTTDPEPIFTVTAVRTSTTTDGQVLHLGHFNVPSTSSSSSSSSSAAAAAAAPTDFPTPFQPGQQTVQKIDTAKRQLYSRLHTAGHVLGSAVRHLCETQIADFDELKASHFPDSASCEFRGLIEGKWKDAIQEKVDAYVAADMPVEIDFWTEDDFRRHGLERLIPDRGLVGEGEKFRVVKIVGAEVYPCGGTHVASTKGCGKTRVKKIARQKGTSRVSYAVD